MKTATFCLSLRWPGPFCIPDCLLQNTARPPSLLPCRRPLSKEEARKVANFLGGVDCGLGVALAATFADGNLSNRKTPSHYATESSRPRGEDEDTRSPLPMRKVLITLCLRVTLRCGPAAPRGARASRRKEEQPRQI